MKNIFPTLITGAVEEGNKWRTSNWWVAELRKVCNNEIKKEVRKEPEGEGQISLRKTQDAP
jgi:hypothetical protein